jgi:hypothetical protein
MLSRENAAPQGSEINGEENQSFDRDLEGQASPCPQVGLARKNHRKSVATGINFAGLASKQISSIEKLFIDQSLAFLIEVSPCRPVRNRESRSGQSSGRVSRDFGRLSGADRTD